MSVRTTSPFTALVGCIAVVYIATTACGCMGTRYYGANGDGSPVEPPVQVPETFQAAPLSHRTLTDHWWTELGSPGLNAAIAAGLADNLELKAAWARLDQAEAITRQTRSALWPTVDGKLSAGRALTAAPPPLGSIESNAFQASVGAGYEVDVWGRTRAAIEASDLDALATRDNVEALAMTLTAQIAEAWFDVVFQRARRQVLREQLEIAQVFLDLTLLRLQMGQATALDVLQQQQQIDILGTQFALMESSEQAAQHRLSLLLGRPPTSIVPQGEDTLPAVGEPFEVAIPRHLLEQRPDVRAARRAVESADARIIVAMADQLPSVRLSAQLLLSATDITGLLDELFWSIGAALSAPLFDGGRRSAEVDRVKAVYRERLFTYGQVLLRALGEVETALMRERQQSAFLREIARQQRTAGAVLETARAQFLRGSSDYSRVIASLNTLLALELSVLDGQRQLLSNRIQLYRALGGTWTQALPRPAASGEQDGS